MWRESFEMVKTGLRMNKTDARSDTGPLLKGHPWGCIQALFATAVVLLSAAAEAADSTAVDTSLYTHHPQKIARTHVAPLIDGRLDDAVWLMAPVQTGFTQRDPDPGKPSSEKTEFRIVYDDEAIYIGAICFDSEPDKITAVLTRRDDWENRDNFNVNLDPHHDHKTGYFFVVGPSGVDV